MLATGAGVTALGVSGLVGALVQARPRRRALDQVEHIVVFMQENRSFDSYFGTLPGVRGFGDRNAHRLPNGRTVFYQPDPVNPDGYTTAT